MKRRLPLDICARSLKTHVRGKKKEKRKQVNIQTRIFICPTIITKKMLKLMAKPKIKLVSFIKEKMTILAKKKIRHIIKVQ